MPDRSQDGTGYCYGFAATQLLQYHECNYKETECQFGTTQDDRLSVLDIIASSNGPDEGLVTGGYTSKVLSKVKRQGMIFKESCAPFSVIINEQRMSHDNMNEMWRYKVISAKKKFSNCKVVDRHKVAAELKSQLNLSADINQIVVALSKSNQNQVYKELFIPEKCEKERAPLKPYNIEVYTAYTKERLLQKINNTLALGTPIAANLCGLNQSQKKYKNGTLDTCGLHSLVISNVREYCCHTKCLKQYEIIDSANSFSNKQYQNKTWINEDILLERFERKWNDPEIGHETDLVWIKDQ